jgi:hypothetical protein
MEAVWKWKVEEFPGLERQASGRGKRQVGRSEGRHQLVAVPVGASFSMQPWANSGPRPARRTGVCVAALVVLCIGVLCVCAFVLVSSQAQAWQKPVLLVLPVPGALPQMQDNGGLSADAQGIIGMIRKLKKRLALLSRTTRAWGTKVRTFKRKEQDLAADLSDMRSTIDGDAIAFDHFIRTPGPVGVRGLAGIFSNSIEPISSALFVSQR